jgi:glycosyltransferase involved in cell wall biosynthesis
LSATATATATATAGRDEAGDLSCTVAAHAGASQLSIGVNLPQTPSQPLVFVSKSTWEPSIRREHAWAEMAASRGHDVVFIESPCDVRALRSDGPRRWSKGLLGATDRTHPGQRIEVVRRSTVIPGHHSSAAARLNVSLLHQVLRRSVPSQAASIVCSWPWDWPAVARTPASRRIFDMADDWGELMPGRAERFASLYELISREADAIVVVNPALRARFPDRKPVVVRNGVDLKVIGGPAGTDFRQENTMIYVGTLTPRFDARLMHEVLAALPDWRLELIGQAMYPQCGDRPSGELQRLLDLTSQVSWRGPRSRSESIACMDQATVAIAPNRPEHSLGQDSMKFYDYSARGMPIVSTRWFAADAEIPPGLMVAESAVDFARCVCLAAICDEHGAQRRRDWAGEHTWTRRWGAWSNAVLGTPTD